MFCLYTYDEFNQDNYNKCLALMEPERREKILTGKHKQTRDMSIFGEWMVKTELSKISGVSIEKINLARTSKGKPYAVNLPYHFSISHCENLLAIAIGKKEIGIDIEIIKPLKNDVTKMLCTKSDMSFLKSAESGTEQLLYFYKIWTAKEAYFKMLGSGITNLKNINYNDIKPQHIIKDNCIISIVQA